MGERIATDERRIEKTSAKTAILSTEILQAKCVISRDVGHFYVGVESGYWNVIGEDRWEIDLKEGEQKEIHFAVKLVTSPISTVPERVPLTVRVGTDPFKKAVIGFWGFGTQITILDSQQLTVVPQPLPHLQSIFCVQVANPQVSASLQLGPPSVASRTQRVPSSKRPSPVEK